MTHKQMNEFWSYILNSIKFVLTLYQYSITYSNIDIAFFKCRIFAFLSMLLSTKSGDITLCYIKKITCSDFSRLKNTSKHNWSKATLYYIKIFLILLKIFIVKDHSSDITKFSFISHRKIFF